MKFYKCIFLYFFLLCIDNSYQNILSPTSSCSRSRSGTPVQKRKRCNSSNDFADTRNTFWKHATDAVKSLEAAEPAHDGLKHWILYLEEELRKIKDPKTLKYLQRKIIELVDSVDTQ